jgi:hypothetical protein
MAAVANYTCQVVISRLGKYLRKTTLEGEDVTNSPFFFA